jgi:hypothetical protein
VECDNRRDLKFGEDVEDLRTIPASVDSIFVLKQSYIVGVQNLGGPLKRKTVSGNVLISNSRTRFAELTIDQGHDIQAFR